MLEFLTASEQKAKIRDLTIKTCLMIQGRIALENINRPTYQNAFSPFCFITQMSETEKGPKLTN